MKSYSKEIKAYALKNAIEFGRADAGRILPKLFQHGLKKEEVKGIIDSVNKIADEINSMPDEERKAEFDKLKSVVKVHEEKERELAPLPEANNKMIFRLAPFPSGALHIGNAKTYLLNALYAKKYNAKIKFIMDDTIGSEEKQPLLESYKLMKDAFDWLDVKYEKPIIYKSDRLKIYYEYAEKLIEKGKAYVCHCAQSELKENRAKGIECGCRQLPIGTQKERWKLIFTDREGDAVLRIKTSMQDPNPAFRDRVLFKISDREHPRVGKKYRVWPTLEMTWAIDDHLLGITHILRGNDLMIETDMEKYMWDIFGWKHPICIHTGLIRIEGAGAKISKSKAQKEVKSGEFIGWDDPRTWSMQSLKRRGIRKEAIREFVKEIGLNKGDVVVPIESLYAINRKMIDAESLRYSFVQEPVELSISNMPDWKGIEVPVHPDKKEKREIKLGKIFISMKDFDELKGKEIRLLHLFNINMKEKTEVTSIDNKDIPKINWVSNGLKTRILMPDGTWASGIADPGIKKINKNEVVQFERFGFVRFDKKHKIEGKDTYEFWFAHQ